MHLNSVLLRERRICAANATPEVEMGCPRSDNRIVFRLLKSFCSALLLGSSSFAETPSIQPIALRPDDAPQRALPGLVKGSHVKVFIPSLPYLYTSHSVNGALIKPSDNEQGWEYDMATSHRQLNDTTYEFTLRQGVQSGPGTVNRIRRRIRVCCRIQWRMGLRHARRRYQA